MYIVQNNEDYEAIPLLSISFLPLLSRNVSFLFCSSLKNWKFDIFFDDNVIQ